MTKDNSYYRGDLDLFLPFFPLVLGPSYSGEDKGRLVRDRDLCSLPASPFAVPGVGLEGVLVVKVEEAEDTGTPAEAEVGSGSCAGLMIGA